MAELQDNTYIGSPDNPKTAAVVSYITFIGWLIAYFGLYRSNKSAHSSFHLRQSLLIHIISFFLKVLYGFYAASVTMFIIICIAGVALFILWFIGFLDALNGRQKLVPLLGALAQRMFKKI